MQYVRKCLDRRLSNTDAEIRVGTGHGAAALAGRGRRRFQDKAHLFHAVIQASATWVAEAQIASIDHYLRKVTDVEADLIAFGRAWVTPTPDHALHFALVRRVNAEAEHIPPATIEVWQHCGPLRVRRALAERLQELAAQGLLRIEDPQRAALHFALLIAAPDPSYRAGAARDAQDIAEVVAAGVRAFLYGYRGSP